jgi:hypothetical protein
MSLAMDAPTEVILRGPIQTLFAKMRSVGKR